MNLFRGVRLYILYEIRHFENSNFEIHLAIPNDI